MKKIISMLLFFSFTFAFAQDNPINCREGEMRDLVARLKYNQSDWTKVPAEYKSDLDTAVTAVIGDCKDCQKKTGPWRYEEKGDSSSCYCSTGWEVGDECKICNDVIYNVANEKFCLKSYSENDFKLSADPKAYCESYGKTFTPSEDGDAAKATCGGDVSVVATSTTSVNRSTSSTTNAGLTPEELAIFANLPTTREKRQFCKDKGMKYKGGSCEEKGDGLFSSIGDKLSDIDVGSTLSDLAGNEMVQGAALGLAAGAGIGLVDNKFYEEKCSDGITAHEKCKDIAFKLKKYDDLEEYCTGRESDKKCVDEFFNNARSKFKDLFCENPREDSTKAKCKSLDKDAFYEEQCTSEKVTNLKSEQCFAMKDDNPRLFFEIYCDPEADSAKSLKMTPEFAAAGVEGVCKPLIKQFGEPEEDEDDDEPEEVEEPEEEEAEEPEKEEAEEPEEEEAEEPEDDEVAMNDDADSDEDSDDDGDAFSSSDLGRNIASVAHSSATVDFSSKSDDEISQLANQGKFNTDDSYCSGSIYTLEADCSMRNHPNYLLKGKLGKVKLVGQKTLVCVFENHTGAKFSAVIKKDCQL